MKLKHVSQQTRGGRIAKGLARNSEYKLGLIHSREGREMSMQELIINRNNSAVRCPVKLKWQGSDNL